MTLRSISESTSGRLGIYAALAIAFTWPLFPSMTTHLPHGSNDIWQNLWNFWWWREALVELGRNPYATDLLFHPHGVSLALHTHSTFNQIAAFPVNLLLGPIAALNFATLLGFALSGFAAHQLAYEIRPHHGAAYLAGLIFAFFPHHFEQSLEHLNLSSLQFLPWVALYGLRIVRGGSRRDVLLFAIVFCLNALSCWHYALFTVLILPYLVCAELYREPELRRRIQQVTAQFLISGAIVALMLAPFAVLMLAESTTLESYAKPPVERGVDLAFLFVPSDHHPVWGKLTTAYYLGHRAYRALGSQAYLGYTALLLASLALLRTRRDRAVIAWSLIFVTSLVLALGAHPSFGGETLGFSLPHAGFEHLPLLKSLRVANRFIVISMLALAVLSSIGFTAALAKRPHAALVFFVLIAFESLWLPYPIQPVAFSPILDQLAEEAPGAILDIPFSGDSTAALNLAYQTRHGRPIAGGYISVGPYGAAAIESDPILLKLSGLTPTSPTRIDVDHLRTLGFSHVVLHKDRTRQAMDARLAQLPPSASYYQRRQFEQMPGMPREIFEKISQRFEFALGPPSAEDANVRVFRLTP